MLSPSQCLNRNVVLGKERYFYAHLSSWMVLQEVMVLRLKSTKSKLDATQLCFLQRVLSQSLTSELQSQLHCE